jgi:hypothetical protein
MVSITLTLSLLTHLTSQRRVDCTPILNPQDPLPALLVSLQLFTLSLLTHLTSQRRVDCTPILTPQAPLPALLVSLQL